MTFINPVFFYGLGFAILPLLVYLLIKPKPQRVVFPAILLAMKLPAFRRHRDWLEILLIFLRTVLLLVLILVFSRPLYNVLTHTAAHVIIIIDNSFSMDYGRGENFSAAHRQAEKLLSAMKWADRASILLTAEPEKIYTGLDRLNALDTLAQVQISHRCLDLPGLRANLDKVFAVKDLPKRNRMYLFSDFQKHDWYNVQEIRTVHEVELFTPVFFKTGSNVFITGAAFIPGINDTRAAIEIYNNSSHHIAPLCRAEINGKPAGECIVHCPPHSGRKAVMKIEQQELQAGQIIRFTAAASDSLLLDNVHYYTAPGGHGKRKIFMYGAFPEKFRDLLLAAGGSMFSGIYSVTAEPPAKIGKILRSEQLPVLVTDNPAILNTAELLQYGPALTVICRVDQPSPGLDDFFRSGLFPMLPEGKITSEPGKICFIENDGPASYLPHEFTGEFFLNGFCRVKLHSNARPQIFLNENICFYALTDYRGTVIHAFNTGKDLSFFRRNELLPMLRNILQETRIPVHASLLPGSVFTAEKAITSMEYEGTGEKPRGILSNSSFLPSAGVYYFTSGKTRQAVVCNPDTRESILDQIPGKQIREISESVLGVRINYKTAHDQETGWRELWRLLLFIAMGISVMELVLAQLIRRGIREKN